MNVESLLLKEFDRRARLNPAFTLRSYARVTGLSHSMLSMIFSGKRRLKNQRAQKVFEKIGVMANELDTANPSTPKKQYHQISLEDFNVISDWFFLAILSLLDIPKFNFTPRSISNSLKIPFAVAKQAVAILKEKKIIAQTTEGDWYQTKQPLVVNNVKSSADAQKFHRQLFAKAQEAMEEEEFAKRSISAIAMAIDPDLVAYAHDRIAVFRRQLMQELEKKSKNKRVYYMCIQLFPVSKES